jgi:hypothetical protein
LLQIDVFWLNFIYGAAMLNVSQYVLIHKENENQVGENEGNLRFSYIRIVSSAANVSSDKLNVS